MWTMAIPLILAGKWFKNPWKIIYLLCSQTSYHIWASVSEKVSALRWMGSFKLGDKILIFIPKFQIKSNTFDFYPCISVEKVLGYWSKSKGEVLGVRKRRKKRNEYTKETKVVIKIENHRDERTKILSDLKEVMKPEVTFMIHNWVFKTVHYF